MAKTFDELIEILGATEEEKEIKNTPTKKKKGIKIKGKSSNIKDIPTHENTKMISLPGVFYLGYVNGFRIKPIAVSDNRELVKMYLENHRHLNRHLYHIEKITDLSEHEIFIRYHDQLLVEFDGYYIPSVDTVMIDFYRRNIESEIYNTIKNLANIDLLVKDIKAVSNGERNVLFEAMKILDRFQRDPEILKEIEHEDMLTNSILFEDMQSYIISLANFDELMDMKNRYEYQIYKDEDFVMQPGGASIPFD